MTSFFITHTNIYNTKLTESRSFGQQVGLVINCSKTKVMPININTANAVKIKEQDLELTHSFTYLGSTICHDGSTSKHIGTRINKARATSLEIWTI